MSENLDLVLPIIAAWEPGDYGSAAWADPEIEYTMVAAVDRPHKARPRFCSVSRTAK